jgi:hypothetical protein
MLTTNKKTDKRQFTLLFDDIAGPSLCCACNCNRLVAINRKRPLCGVPCPLCYERDPAYSQACFFCPCDYCQQPPLTHGMRQRRTARHINSDKNSMNTAITHFFYSLQKQDAELACDFLPVVDNLFHQKLFKFSFEQLQRLSTQDLLGTYNQAIEDCELYPSLSSNFDREYKQMKIREQERV